MIRKNLNHEKKSLKGNCTHKCTLNAMLHVGQVEIVAIVMPLMFDQSLLILCGYFTNIFEIREHLKLCFVFLL